MAITNDDFDRLRTEVDLKLNTVTVDHMKTATAIGAYAERFNGLEARIDAVDSRIDALAADMDRRFDTISADMDRRFDTVSSDMDRRFDTVSSDMDRRFDAVERRMDRFETKLDTRFGWQTVFMALLGALVLFDDAIRVALGL